MALRFADTFDHYATAAIAQKWTAIVGTAYDNPTIASVGRYSTQGLQASTAGNRATDPVSVVLSTASGATCIVGFAYQLSAGSFTNHAVGTNADVPSNPFGGSPTNKLFVIRQGGSVQLWATILTNGQIRFYRGDGTILGTSASALSAATWAYIEAKVVIDNSTGTITLNVNGTEWLALTGLDTQNTGSATWDEVVIASLVITDNTTTTWVFDDVLIGDGTGAAYNDFWGDLHGTYIPASAAGFYQDGTPVTDPTLVECVDELLADGDTSYFTESTATDRDSFSISAGWPGDGTLGPIQVVSQQRKDGGGTAEATLFVRIDSTNYDGSVQGVGDSYAILREIYEENPDTSAAWAAGAPPEIGTEKTT